MIWGYLNKWLIFGCNLLKNSRIMKFLINSLLLQLILFSNLPGADKYPRSSSIDIVHYSFSIYLSDSYDLIRGEAAIRILHTGETDLFELDLASQDQKGMGMIVEQVLLDEDSVRWSHEGNRLIIYPGKNKKAGETSRILVKYYGIPRDGLIISRNRYGDRTFFADNWPDRARNWIPCVDHPSDKATVEFIVYSPMHYMVVSNGYLYEESILPDGIKLTHWKEDISIPTKVMVIGVARFAKQLAGTAGGTEIWSWVFPEDREAGFIDYSDAIGPFIYFSEKMGVYSYEKLANVQSKTMFGGMENAGCIFYSERSVTGNKEAERLMAHEIAHQWFGNSVTEGDWHHVWLSEGFATYLTTCYMEYRYGEEKLKADMQRARLMVISAYKRSPAPVIDTTVTEFMKLLNTNSYQKGAWILHMLRNEVGDKAFNDGIRIYYNRYRNRTALTQDFIEVMEEVSGKDMSLFFNQWLNRPEIPLISIGWSESNRRGEATITIEQLQEGGLFDIPLELEIVTDEGSEVQIFRINKESQSFVIKTGGKIKSLNQDPGVKLLFMMED